MRFLIVPCLLLSALPSAFASTLYKCTDDSGVVLYTNQKSSKKGCEVLSHVAPPPAAGTRTASAPSRPRASSTPTPADFPRVSSNEQRARDNDRKAILDKELANELQLLDQAKKALNEAGTRPADQLKGLRDTLALHERNIEALQKELGKLR